MSDRSALDEAVAAVAAAWNDPGPMPKAHLFAQRKLKRSWPTLAEAVEALAEAVER